MQLALHLAACLVFKTTFNLKMTKNEKVFDLTT